MRKARLLHNPNAGEGKFRHEELLQLLTEKGYTVTYADAKKRGWARWDEDDDMIIVAGGDGTVRKLVRKLVKRQLIAKRFPIAVLPLGTANNIASTFYTDKEVQAVIAQWEKQCTRSIDIARVRGIDEENFFMEGLGVGVFPSLMRAMEERGKDRENADPREELRIAQQLFAEIVGKYKPGRCRLIVDGEDHSGDYVLVEIMNMQAVGPNLELAPNANPSDGVLEIVLVSAGEQEALAAYARRKAAGDDVHYPFKTIQGKDIRLEYNASLLHVDDQLIKVDKDTMIHVQLEPGLLVFFVDGESVEEVGR